MNDATALLLFSGALAVQASGGLDMAVGVRLGRPVSGGVLFGMASGLAVNRLARFVDGTLGGNLLQFATAFLVWVVQHLGRSAVLAMVAMAIMAVARSRGRGSPRMRVHSFAVWAMVVFLLNVFAFLLMGLQARTTVGAMPPARPGKAFTFAGLVAATVIATRVVVAIAWNRVSIRFAVVRRGLPAHFRRQALLVGWSGMRGLVTPATAFAWPWPGAALLSRTEGEDADSLRRRYRLELEAHDPARERPRGAAIATLAASRSRPNVTGSTTSRRAGR